MLSDSEKALAEMMAAQFMDKGDAAAVEPAEGTVKITFFEKGNTVDSSIEGIASRMQFDGCFAIDEYMIQRKDGTLALAPTSTTRAVRWRRGYGSRAP